MMADPVVVYQLSLRIGASYEATCRSLMRRGVGVIKRRTLDAFWQVQPRAIKKSDSRRTMSHLIFFAMSGC